MDKELNAFPMHVVLLEEGNFMRSVWLPSEKEGKYSFDTADSRDEIPIYIVAEDNA